MFKALVNQRGNISIALLMAVIGVMSGMTMTTMAMRDVVTFHWDFEDVQGLHFLRSEASRGQAILEKAGEVNGEMYTPQRAIPVYGSNMKKTFLLQSKIAHKTYVSTGVTDEDGNSGEIGTSQGYVIQSLINARRGVSEAAFAPGNASMIRKYGEFMLRKQRYSEFMYFTETDESTNETPVYFYGPDVVYGRVHSNSDIWIKQAGGGTNGGWPTFYDLVSTAGRIQVSGGGTPPWEEVFIGGYIEGYRKFAYPTQMNTIRRNGTKIGDGDPDKIYMVTVNGSSFEMIIGTIGEPEINHALVYNPYPANPLGTPLFRNTFTMRDTVWIQAPGGSAAQRTMFVDGKLWIRGNFSGNQTWGTSDTLFLIDDITYMGTQVGLAPDTMPMNRTDILGLVSEKSILIKYGHRDPLDSLRYYPNCGPDGTSGTNTGINIYAALCALGDGAGDPHKDGVFSFEYQHPHPSTPAVNAGGTLWTLIDIHRRKFPQNTTNPWPPQLDYPWYNPLWPERLPYLERGHINLWGSVAQRRRGFVHRNVLDTEYQTNGVWNIPIDACGGSSAVNTTDPVFGFQMATRNFPGATGGGTGYKKNYHYDTRFYYRAPRDFPEVNLQGGDAPMRTEAWILKRPPRTL